MKRLSVVSALVLLASFIARADGWESIVLRVAPPPRMDAVGAASGTRLYLSGGRAQDGAVLNDLWVYTERGGWSELSDFQASREFRPGDTNGSALVVRAPELGPDNLWFFIGTNRPDEPSLQVWTWNRSIGWAQVETFGHAPRVWRFEHAVDVLTDGRMILMGARTQDGEPDPFIYILDPVTRVWSTATRAPMKPPISRKLKAVGDRVYVASGREHLAEEALALWVYHLETGEWEEKRPSNRDFRPESRFGYAVVHVANILLLLGGKSDSKEQFLDTWEWELEVEKWVRRADMPIELVEARSVGIDERLRLAFPAVRLRWDVALPADLSDGSRLVAYGITRSYPELNWLSNTMRYRP